MLMGSTSGPTWEELCVTYRSMATMTPIHPNIYWEHKHMQMLKHLCMPFGYHDNMRARYFQYIWCTRQTHDWHTRVIHPCSHVKLLCMCTHVLACIQTTPSAGIMHTVHKPILFCIHTPCQNSSSVRYTTLIYNWCNTNASHLLWSTFLIFSQDPFKFSYPPLPDDIFQNPMSETGQEDDTESKNDDLEAKDTLEPSSPTLRTRNVVHRSPYDTPWF